MTSIEAAAVVRPLYIFAKPPPEVARLVDRERRARGIDARYAPERFHITLARFGDSRGIARTTFAQIDQAITSLRIEPCRVQFDRIQRNILIGGKGLSGLRAVQQALVRRLGNCGVSILSSTAQPHVSLAYDAPFVPDIVIAPIVWRVDELLLVISHHGEGRHEVLRRWPLTVRQFMLPFAA